jgi:hypothetical protein
MRRRFGMRTLLAAVAVVALIAALIAAADRAARNRILVENRSGLAVVGLRIAVGPNRIGFSTLDPGRTVDTTFSLRGDASFAVSGRLADGTPIGGNFGYVTGGMFGETAHFTIGPGGEILYRQNGE